jgi:hypothetical protein
MMCLFRSLLIVLFALSIAAPSRAQWQQISTIPEAVSVIKFFSASYGFIGTGSSPGGPVPASAGIYRTVDGGFTWSLCTIPPNNGREVTDFCMMDSLRGWASVTGNNSGMGIWSTSDGGITWNATNLQLLGGSSVAMTSKALVVTDLFGNTVVSKDTGKTWLTLPDRFKNDVTFFDDIHGITTAYRGASWCTTADGGITWNNSPQAIESWSVYPVRNTSEAFAAPEGSSSSPGNSVAMISTDYGNTWQNTAFLPFQTTGHITGLSDTALFIQWGSNENQANANIPWLKHGIYRSVDKAKTWTFIGGPEALNDTRFCTITGCGQGYLYTFEEPFPFHGPTKIWRYQFPVSFDVHGQPILPTRFVKTSSKVCADALSKILFSSAPCQSYILKSIRFLDSELVRAGALSIVHVPALPRTYQNGDHDSITYLWHPKSMTARDTTAFDSIALTYFDPVTGTTHDTTIILTLHAVSDTVAPEVSPKWLEFPLTSTCSSADSLLYVINPGCEPMTIDSVRIGDREFSVLRYDTAIAPGSRGAIYIHYKPSADEILWDTLDVFATEEGIQTVRHIPVFGNGKQGLGILAIAATSLDAGSISFCVGDTALSSPFYNVGCDTLVISNIRFTSDGTFTLISQPKDSLLAPNGSDFFSFLFAPRLKDQHHATLTFHSRNLHGTDKGHDTSIELRGFGLGGAKILAEAPSSVDFGWIYQCQSRDTIITLYNHGCDTLHVTDGSFSNPSFTSAMVYPKEIAPGDSLVVDVHVDTSLSNGTSTIAGEFIAHSSDADNSLAPIPLRVLVVPPVHLALQILKPDSAYAGDKVTYVIRLVGPHSPSLFSAFHFDLVHNDDLLSFVSLTGSGLNVVSDSPDSGIMIQHFTLAPATLPDTIGWLTFKAYLSKESTTSLSIAKFDALNVIGVSEDCIVTLADSGSRFTYRERCGEDLMRSVLEGKQFFFDRIVPNPARNTISVIVKQFVDGPIAYELSDELGRTVLQGTDIRGTSLPVQDISSGTYYLRLRQDDVVATQRVLIQH